MCFTADICFFFKRTRSAKEKMRTSEVEQSRFTSITLHITSRCHNTHMELPCFTFGLHSSPGSCAEPIVFYHQSPSSQEQTYFQHDHKQTKFDFVKSQHHLLSLSFKPVHYFCRRSSCDTFSFDQITFFTDQELPFLRKQA